MEALVLRVLTVLPVHPAQMVLQELVVVQEHQEQDLILFHQLQQEQFLQLMELLIVRQQIQE